MKKRFLLVAATLFSALAQANDSLTIRHISDDIMLNGGCYDNLHTLCKNIGHRLSGSAQAAQAVIWGQKAMETAGADRVWLQAVDVPRWVRGKESLKLPLGPNNSFISVPMLSLGNSEGTKGKALKASIIMVNNFEEFKNLTEAEVQGKFVFFNYRFRQDWVNTFAGYGDAVKYRWATPSIAAAKSAAGVIIRSVSTGADDVPHTGSMRYSDSSRKLPEVAIGNQTADKLEAACKARKEVMAVLQSECRMEGTVPSYNVVGEIKGSEHPEEIVVFGGHLDSWDVGEGAHDDGAGCVQAIEVIRTMKALGIRPKRTIRAVLFMNEENGARGGAAYADSALKNKEKTILALESDAGGFSPRGFGTEGMKPHQKLKVQGYAPLFLPYGVYDFSKDEGGADISFLGKQGIPMMGLLPDPQRYFDLHHTNSDVFEEVNHRELKLGAVAMTSMVYLVSEYGL